MEKLTGIAALRTQVGAWRQQNKTIALVPTMGNLHPGHLALVSKAKQVADKVIVSIFINPLQFDQQADLSAYPRTVNADLQQLTAVAADAVFIPTVALMYPKPMVQQTMITVPGLTDILCGHSRPGHFNGVATVVVKLFNLVQADIAVFGDKDYQQLLLIKKMVIDLNLPVKIISVPTMRESNGLAMSSRNHNLSEQQRYQAAKIYQLLLSIKTELENGNSDFASLEQKALEQLTQSGFAPDYVAICHPVTLAPATQADETVRVLLAARLGAARLIDNIEGKRRI